jgi:DNA-binding response OmpR family regulator
MPDGFDFRLPAIGLRPARVLVVEDHRLVRHVMARALRGSGLVALEADTAAAARNLAGGVELDAAVLDITLPGEMNGAQLARWLRRRQPNLPLLFVTGLNEWDLPAEMLQDGRARLLRKPFGARTIVEFVSGLLGPRFGVDDMTAAD